jgi:hypothetical protein
MGMKNDSFKAGGVHIGGNVTVTNGHFVGGNLHQTSHQTGVSSQDLATLIAVLSNQINQHALPADTHQKALIQLDALNTEAQQARAQGRIVDSSKTALLGKGFIALVPEAAKAVVSAFASPLLGAVAGTTTHAVLQMLGLGHE